MYQAKSDIISFGRGGPKIKVTQNVHLVLEFLKSNEIFEMVNFFK